MISSKSNYNPTIGAKGSLSLTERDSLLVFFNSLDNHSATI